MGNKKTPKKGSTVDTPAKPEGKKSKQAKNTPAMAAVEILKLKKKTLFKESKGSPKSVALQTPKIKKAALEKEAKSTPEATPKALKNGTPSVKKSKKTKEPKQRKPVENVEMASEGEDEAAPAVSSVEAKPSAKKGASVRSVSSEEAGKFSLFIRGLNYESEQDKVCKHFQQFGTVRRCSLPRNPAKSSQIRGFGFVEYNTQEAMDKALAAAHTLDSRTLQVSINKAEKGVAGKRKRDESQQPGGDKKRQIPQIPKFDHELFVAKLKYTTTSNSIQKHFTQFGKVLNVGLPMKNMKNATGNKGFAFVAFKDASSLKKALAKPNQQIDSTNIVVTISKKPTASDAPKQSFPNEVFVGGLDHFTEKPTLMLHFSKYGKVTNITLPWNKEAGKNKGFGFVSFESAASLKEAMGEDHEIDGMQVVIKVGKKAEEDGGATQKTKSMKLQAASAVEEMEDDGEEDEEDSDEEEGVEGEESDNDDDELEGESDEAENEAEEDGDDDAVENDDEEDESDEDGNEGEDNEDDVDDEDDDDGDDDDDDDE